ncbi:TPA: fimbria/pilus periplasmic chaperone [Aeromonas hydrophila]|uniref:fimbria/pilus periplasmic chaperone n=1 Tax=Aeromonas hydrophila TaxID=644 RepID=UPI0028D9AAFF|nr:fimbria/pilus periplasmic chaperone [Aeromonas hydrophila]
MSKNLFNIFLILFFSTSSTIVSAGGVSLGATRVVYNSEEKEAKLTVINSDSRSNFLVQSWVEDGSGNKIKAFIITPPLFLLRSDKESSLRIIYAGDKLPDDRESLFWINVKVIPSIDDSYGNKNTMQIAIQNRIKLFYRPNSINKYDENLADRLKFKLSKGRITVSNPTPYYITLVNVKSEVGKSVSNHIIPPLADFELSKDLGTSNELSYQTVNDYGALTPIRKIKI